MEVEAVLHHVKSIVDSEIAAQNTQSPYPFITLTYAQSIDGCITAQRGTPTLLSGPASMKMTHLLRTIHDAILVGIGTILADNPSLNARLVQGRNPCPVIVDTNLRCPSSIKLLTLSSCMKPIILCSDHRSNDVEMKKKRCVLENSGAVVISCPTKKNDEGRDMLDLRHALCELKSRLNIKSIMIEGGASIISTCLRESIKENFVDRVIITIAPTFIGGVHAVQSNPNLVSAYPRLNDTSYLKLESDLIILGRPTIRSTTVDRTTVDPICLNGLSCSIEPR